MNIQWFRKPDPFDLAIWGLILTLIIAGIYYLQLRSMQNQQGSMQQQVIEMQKQTAEVRRQTEISERPWLSIEAAPGTELFFVNGQASMNVKFTIRNVGHSLAKDVSISVKFLASTPLGVPIAFDARKNQAELCDHPPRDITFDLFPTDDHPIDRVLSMSTSKDALDAAAVNLPGTTRRAASLYFVGCINYRASFSTDLHQTLFGFHLIGPWILENPKKQWPPLKLPNGVALVEAFELGVTVPQSRLTLLQDITARNDAT